MLVSSSFIIVKHFGEFVGSNVNRTDLVFEPVQEVGQWSDRLDRLNRIKPVDPVDC